MYNYTIIMRNGNRYETKSILNYRDMDRLINNAIKSETSTFFEVKDTKKIVLVKPSEISEIIFEKVRNEKI